MKIDDCSGECVNPHPPHVTQCKDISPETLQYTIRWQRLYITRHIENSEVCTLYWNCLEAAFYT